MKHVSKIVIATPGEGETNMYLDQPAENNVNAREEAVVGGNSSTASDSRADEAATGVRIKSWKFCTL
jgi:hypothetical protein